MTPEQRTVDLVLQGNSLARFGDGEIKLLYGVDSLTQVYTEKVSQELWRVLEDSPAIIGLPHIHGKRSCYWRVFLSLYPPKLNRRQQYGSSFISRPDEAGDIPLTPIWQGRDVVLVTGGGSLSAELMPEASSVTLIECPQRDAYSEIDSLEEQIPSDADLVILCAGATATCLADRLARKNIQGVDLGFSGKFMRNMRSDGFQSHQDTGSLHQPSSDSRLQKLRLDPSQTTPLPERDLSGVG